MFFLLFYSLIIFSNLSVDLCVLSHYMSIQCSYKYHGVLGVPLSAIRGVTFASPSKSNNCDPCLTGDGYKIATAICSYYYTSLNWKVLHNSFTAFLSSQKTKSLGKIIYFCTQCTIFSFISALHCLQIWFVTVPCEFYKRNYFQKSVPLGQNPRVTLVTLAITQQSGTSVISQQLFHGTLAQKAINTLQEPFSQGIIVTKELCSHW